MPAIPGTAEGTPPNLAAIMGKSPFISLSVVLPSLSSRNSRSLSSSNLWYFCSTNETSRAFILSSKPIFWPPSCWPFIGFIESSNLTLNCCICERSPPRPLKAIGLAVMVITPALRVSRRPSNLLALSIIEISSRCWSIGWLWPAASTFQ